MRIIKDILEDYLKQGFVWIYKCDKSNLKDKSKTTRIFYSEPWFSIEGGFTWVDINSCGCGDSKKMAIFIDLQIVDLDKPIKISEYIEKYCK